MDLKAARLTVWIVAVVALCLLAVYAITAWIVQSEGGAAGRMTGGIENFRALDAPAPAPDLPFADAAGRTLTLADFRGRWVLVNLWATWCAPCLEELPALDRLQAARGGPGFEVLAISLDRAGPEIVEEYRQKLGIAHLAFYQDATMRLSGAFRAPGLPTTVLIDPEGREVARLLGPAEWDGAAAMDRLDAFAGR